MSDNEDSRPKLQVESNQQQVVDAEKDDLERRIFGGGGESDSDLSDADEENRVSPRRDSPALSPTAGSGKSRSPTRSRSRSSGSGGGAGDEDREERQASASGSDGEFDGGDDRLPSIKKKGSSSRSGQGEDGEKRRKSAPKKRKSAPVEEEEEMPVDLNEDDLRKIRLNQKIDAIIKPAKKKKKSKKGGDDDLDELNDERVAMLREKMEAAAKADDVAISEKRPATAKLSMLREVMNVLQQSTMAQSIIDNGLLKAVKIWLEPLRDKSLPALDIQNSFFDILVKMPLDTDTLKASELGKVVLFYSKSLRSTSHIKRQAEMLLAAWSRPIIKRSSSFRTKSVPTIDIERSRATQLDGSVIKKDAIHGYGGLETQGTKDKKRRNVRIPAPSNVTYTHAPKYDATGGASSQGPSSQGNRDGAASQAQAQRQREAERMKKVKKALNTARASQRQ